MDNLTLEMMVEELKRKHIFELTKKGSLKMDNRCAPIIQLVETVLKYIRNRSYIFGPLENMSLNDTKDIVREALTQIQEDLRQESFIGVELPSDLPSVDYKYLESLLPTYDLETRQYYLYSPIQKRLSEYPHEFWIRTLPKEVTAPRMHKIIPCKVVYDPLDSEMVGTTKADKTDIVKINSYNPPEWKSLPYSGDMPDLAKRFFKHLFPNKEVRVFVYTWLYHMMTKRARTFLYLPAGQGIGKTTFAYLCSSLVGRLNFEMGKADFAENNFNGYIAKKRLVFLDEFNCYTEAEKETLKRIMNDHILIESKGRDQYTINNYCSFIIANNNPESVSIDPVDRRFSVPEMTTKKLTDAFSIEEIEELNDLKNKEDSQFIADVGHWILETFSEPNYTQDFAWQKERFEEVVFASAREGYKYILDQVLSGKADKYSYSRLRNEYRVLHNKNAPFPTWFKVRDYIDGFRHNGKPVAKTQGNGSSMEIVPI